MTEKIVSTLQQHIHDYSRQQFDTKAQHLFNLNAGKNSKLCNWDKLDLDIKRKKWTALSQTNILGWVTFSWMQIRVGQVLG